ncbi:DNA adenine methylase [Magnetospirillum sp. ME-1]|uniref:DNA adenine methylase n=1 Tax=Magnetospirillum sp. ME-1 TaxID=1639348 RepID=UPI00143DA7E4|nr:Dam family site-specific DNA-(adenine-N6)-methyltransferase [Magnetospirillum sp. ME-1]
MAEPVVKWVGGKRRLLPELARRLPADMRGYHEPFLGGGALFFSLRPAQSLLTDFNGELINLYRVIKICPRQLMTALEGFEFTEAEYYRMRDLDRSPGFAALSDLERAARFLYLSKTSFNGLWRVNRLGHHNGGWGKRGRVALYRPDNLMEVHEALRTARLAQAHYSHVLVMARPGDFVYFDPPYDTERGEGSVGYTTTGFSRMDQQELWQVCIKLHRMGARWMQSNADTPFIRRLYRAFRIEGIHAPRSLAGDPKGRAAAREVIVRNY